MEKAKALLKEAGYENGFSFTITVPSNYQPHVDTAVVLVEQLKEVGVTAQIQQVEWNTWLSDVYSARNFESTVCGFDKNLWHCYLTWLLVTNRNSFTHTLNASAMLARWVSDNGKNMINYNNPQYDEVFAQAQATADEAEQTALYKQCLEILSDTAANVYLQDLADFVAINPAVQGFEFYPLYVIDMSLLSIAE